MLRNGQLNTVSALPCRPIGSLTPPRTTSTRCGYPRCDAEIRPTAWGDHNWLYADTTGSIYGDQTPTSVKAGSKEWWDWQAANNMETYSTLRATLDICGNIFRHLHQPAATWDYPDENEVKRRIAGYLADPNPSPPRCCGQPMNAVPVGWRCRAAKTVARYATDVAELTAA